MEEGRADRGKGGFEMEIGEGGMEEEREGGMGDVGRKMGRERYRGREVLLLYISNRK